MIYWISRQVREDVRFIAAMVGHKADQRPLISPTTILGVNFEFLSIDLYGGNRCKDDTKVIGRTYIHLRE